MGEPLRSNGISDARKLVFTIGMWIVPIALSIVAGYGAAKSQAGAQEQRVAACEVQLQQVQKQLDRANDRFVTRDELKAYLEGQRDVSEQTRRTLAQVEQDVRTLRTQLLK
jgi:hypothetical protein